MGQSSFFFFKTYVFIYWGGGAEGEKESQADSALSAETNVGLNPMTPRS